MSSDNGNTFIYAVVGFGAGLFWFFKGFRIYREYRVLADTPEIPIRSIPMGLVEIHGKARPADGRLVSSPVTRTPCLFYKVDIERWKQDSKGRGSWSYYRTDADGEKFYLEDGSGKVLADAHNAELDLMQTGRQETYSSGIMSLGLSATGEDLASYVARVCAGKSASLAESLDHMSLGGMLGGGGSGTGRYRLTEYCIVPEHWYDVTGTCAENPNPQDEHDRNLIKKGENEPTFLISWRSEKEIEGTLRNRAIKYIFGGAGLSILCLAIILAKLGWL